LQTRIGVEVSSTTCLIRTYPQRDKHNINSTVQRKGRTDSHHVTQATVRAISNYQ